MFFKQIRHSQSAISWVNDGYGFRGDFDGKSARHRLDSLWH